jgi:hypothetical protein
MSATCSGCFAKSVVSYQRNLPSPLPLLDLPFVRAVKRPHPSQKERATRGSGARTRYGKYLRSEVRIIQSRRGCSPPSNPRTCCYSVPRGRFVRACASSGPLPSARKSIALPLSTFTTLRFRGQRDFTKRLGASGLENLKVAESVRAVGIHGEEPKRLRIRIAVNRQTLRKSGRLLFQLRSRPPRQPQALHEATPLTPLAAATKDGMELQTVPRY